MKYFVERHHCDPANVGANKKSVLQRIIYDGHISILQYLIENGHYDLSFTKQDHDAPLFYAALWETANCEIFSRADPNLRVKHEGTPLFAACLNGYLDIVQYLIPTGHIAQYLLNILQMKSDLQ